ncbi:MAG: hypothetical protein PHQ67_07375 [Fermentimonas sp.]|nr:hypothetical protein [Fermentimonas sp.]MDD4400262.1 hypothetical protein [Dysgonamonadaceae bacterium]
MSKVFRVTPKVIKRTNGNVLTPQMQVIVTTYMRIYNFYYQKACCNKNDFQVEALS